LLLSIQKAAVQPEVKQDVPQFARPTASQLIKDSMTEAEIKSKKDLGKVSHQHVSIISFLLLNVFIITNH
jgi:hypothetical protein